MIYTADVRCPSKPNGLQRHTTRRSKYDLARMALQRSLRPKADPARVSGRLCLFKCVVSLCDNVAGDCDGYLAGILDSISVGKGTRATDRLKIALHPFPLLLDDSQVRGFAPLDGCDRILYLGCGFDRVSFEIVELPD
jgi:hypothetical protein